MREIKFRGKSSNPNHEWVYGDLIHRLDGRPIIRHNLHTEIKHGDEVTIWQEDTVKTITVGQFTGLYDKNGKEIYEGDILACGEYVVVVTWDEYYAKFIMLKPEKKKGKGHEWADFGDMLELGFRIIGNIHDNPELMKGGEK